MSMTSSPCASAPAATVPRSPRSAGWRRPGLRRSRPTSSSGSVVTGIGGDESTIAAVAARHGLAPRSIQRLFERDGSTFSAFKLEQQLAHARRMLANTRYAGWTIGAIAIAAGFGDLSYFHRVFRR